MSKILGSRYLVSSVSSVYFVTVSLPAKYFLNYLDKSKNTFHPNNLIQPQLNVTILKFHCICCLYCQKLIKV